MRFSNQEIEGIINAIVANISLDDFPIDFSKIVRYVTQPVTIYRANFDDDNIAGTCKKIGNEYEIYVNKAQPEVRQRFTIAHELGHIILGHLVDGNQKVDKFRGNSEYDAEEQKEEQEANKFASCLLMPTKHIKALIKQGKKLEELYEYFGVSEQAMKIRLFNLGYTLNG